MRAFIFLFILGSSFLAQAEENKMKAIIEPAFQRNFDDAYEKARLLSDGDKITYEDSHGNEVSERKGLIIEFIKSLERTDKKCKRFLSQESIDGLMADAKKCRSFSPQNDEEAESELGKVCSEYNSKFSEIKKCGEDGEMGNILKSLKSYSGVDYASFIAPYDSKIKELMENQKSLNAQTKKEREQKEEVEKKKVAEEEKMKSTPQYKKCLYMSRIISDKKMLNLWNKNIDEIKKDAKTAGAMTMKMEKDMENSLSFVRTYKMKISEEEKQLKNYSGVSVNEAQCKKMVPNYGVSDADRYSN